MMTTFKKAVSLASALLFAGLFFRTADASQVHETARKFIIYEYVPYSTHIADGEVVTEPSFKSYLESLGIHRIDVIYRNRFMTDGRPDKQKIEDIAKSALAAPGIPASFDTEFGQRFKPETVIPRVSEILRIFHHYNTVIPAGVYATAPQNTFAWKPNTPARFDALNPRYASVARQVDFLSPVLYNYNGGDTARWRLNADYNMQAAKKYHTGKPIIPYINIAVVLKTSKRDKRAPILVRMLTEAQMHARLQALYDLGASGCIVWASTRFRTADGKTPVFDRNSGWGKALADFAQAHG
ncbi:MAG TPA: hypothetical protein VFR20_10165 [Burkholderiaceae bacterium]|nr:hypothetical protein [Burkholderiaceae bacterium]